ncbi:hypothetical protein AURDEDRAFT_166695 [Auricularia subglabra TFB-10046 SS5]|nr:hypothetical protein AURDEDRAFT_166695 [Auricularia subglabra TFB-10046 SS5]
MVFLWAKHIFTLLSCLAEAIYHAVVLRSVPDMLAFRATLVARPELALAVRRIVLPRFAYSFCRSLVADCIILACSAATSLVLPKDAEFLADTPGLRAASHIRHLVLHGGGKHNYSSHQAQREDMTLDILSLLSYLPQLESVSVNHQTLIFPDRRLRVAELRETYVTGSTIDPSAFLFSRQVRILADLALGPGINVMGRPSGAHTVSNRHALGDGKIPSMLSSRRGAADASPAFT